MTDIFGEMQGVAVRNDIYAHIAGIDIVRASLPYGDAAYYVLEDNLRVQVFNEPPDPGYWK